METTRGIKSTDLILAPYDERRPIVSPLPPWLVVHSLWPHHRICPDRGPNHDRCRLNARTGGKVVGGVRCSCCPVVARLCHCTSRSTMQS